MQLYKIDQFGIDNAGKPFPPFESLHPVECDLLLAKIANRLGIDQLAVPLTELPIEVCSRLREQPTGSNVLAEGVCIESALCMLKTKADIYLLWAQDEIDRISASDLVSHFYDIWYPAADDLIIFDKSFTFAVFIDHDGFVYHHIL